MLLPGDKRLVTAGHMRGYTLPHLPEKIFKKISGEMSNFLFTDPYWCINEQIFTNKTYKHDTEN